MTKADTATYIQHMSDELAHIASGVGLSDLAYILAIAAEEAKLHVQVSSPELDACASAVLGIRDQHAGDHGAPGLVSSA